MGVVVTLARAFTRCTLAGAGSGLLSSWLPSRRGWRRGPERALGPEIVGSGGRCLLPQTDRR